MVEGSLIWNQTWEDEDIAEDKSESKVTMDDLVGLGNSIRGTSSGWVLTHVRLLHMA